MVSFDVATKANAAMIGYDARTLWYPSRVRRYRYRYRPSCPLSDSTRTRSCSDCDRRICISCYVCGCDIFQPAANSYAGKAVGHPRIILLIGIAGVWLFMTVALGATSWIMWNAGDAIAASQKDQGPLIWFTNIAMEGGPLSSRNVFSLTFRGANASQSEVQEAQDGQYYLRGEWDGGRIGGGGRKRTYFNQ